jgi:hypothetical protein
LNLDEKIKWRWRNESCLYSKVGKSCPQGYRDAMLTMTKENNQSKKVLPHHKVQQWIIVANECHKKEEQLGMDHAFRTLIEKLQLLKLFLRKRR